MPLSDDIPSSPLAAGSSPEDSLKFYKAQYELLESELADFQASSKDLEAELEKDIEAAEKRERQLKDKLSNLQYEADEWKTKYKQAKSEATAAQNVLQKEVTSLRDENRNLHLKLRDIEVANDDYERQQRNTESSLEDMQQQYSQAFEKAVLFEHEVQKVEQEREGLRIDVQRFKDELQDLKIEAEITREKLRKAEEALERRPAQLHLDQARPISSPRSELSPTTTNTSTPSFDTPPAKTASISDVSDTRTPPSPPISEKSGASAKPFTTPQIAKSRISMNTTPRQPTYTSRPSGHARGISSAIAPRTTNLRQSLSRAPTIAQPSGLPQSSSIMQLRNLRGKMQNLEKRVQKARSKLPAPVDTPPRASPRSGSALGHIIPSSVTVRSRKRPTGSNMTGSQADSDGQSTPSISRSKSSRASLSHQYQRSEQPSSPSRHPMGPPRPGSRTSGMSSRTPGFVPGHSRPGSRASISNMRATLGSGVGSKFAPNASTDRITTRPHSSLSDYQRTTGYDGHFDEDEESILEEPNQAANATTTTPTPRRTTLTRPRTSDIGGSSAIPSPVKRMSLTGTSKVPGPTRRQSQNNINIASRPESRAGDMRPPSRALGGVREGEPTRYDINETF